MATVDRVSWAKSFLQSLEVPITTSNIQIIVGWENAEGGAGPQFGISTNLASFNPLNTKQPMRDPNSRDSGGGIQAYNSWSQGLQATVITLTQDAYGYPGVISMLQRGDATAAEAARAISSSSWDAGHYADSRLTSLIECAAITSNGLTIPTVRSGGAAGLGGTGTPGNSTQISPWIVGDSTNPDQDFWTTINQWTQEAQLYCFSDGETLYVADGIKLMAQTPALVIARTDPRVLSLNLTYDNTSWSFAVTHRRRAGVRRRATLSRMTSPTQATLKVVCDIDDYRGGDVIMLVHTGPRGWVVARWGLHPQRV